MKNCLNEGCQRAVAPSDGEYCGMHSQKLATPYSAQRNAKSMVAVPKSIQAAKNGINTSNDFANFMSGLMVDLVEGTVDPETARAAIEAGDSLLRVVEMRLRHGFKKEALELSENAGGIVAPAHIELNGAKQRPS